MGGQVHFQSTERQARDLNPVWHGTGHFYPVLSAGFFSKFSKVKIEISRVILNFVLYFGTLFWDDITIFWDENLLSFLTEKENLFWTNKKFF